MEMMKAKTLGTAILVLGDSVRHVAARTSIGASRRSRPHNRRQMKSLALKAQLAEQQKQIDALKSALRRTEED